MLSFLALYVAKTLVCEVTKTHIHCEPKKHQNIFLIYSLQNLTDCDKIWYILSGVNLSHRNVNA